ncbi:hypothetical protein [Paenibacillus campinasensis]|uniref:Uncharacterized protein n=1 Tax=Paenibacillus campinasensis TaxID=66347 RepID=A0A268EGZ7_9BACL|nr:hypothetical protein [Paenibacillus campinasensis]PAD72392.1 hypothetical protein CHH67_22385 [Paenibacillus campinasensis]
MNDNQIAVTLPTIPKEVADAIETARKQGACNGTIIDVRNDDFTLAGVSGAVLRLISLDTLLSALINGYAVEKSAEELEREAHAAIREMYRYHTTGVTDEEDDAYADGVLDTLNTLGIKIEGVNA